MCDFLSGGVSETREIKELGAKFVVARAEGDSQAELLMRIGADEVVYPEKELAKWTARRYSGDHILEYFPVDEEHTIIEMELPAGWKNRTVGEIDVRKRYGINIMGVRKNGKLQLSVTEDTRFSGQDTVLVLGDYTKIQKCFSLR